MNWYWDNDFGGNYWYLKDPSGTSLCTVLMFASVVLKWLIMFGVPATQYPNDNVHDAAIGRASSLVMKVDSAVPEPPRSMKDKFLSFLPVSGNYFAKEPTQAQKESYLKKKTFSADEKICKVCYATDSNTIVNVCGHGGMCDTCARDVVKKVPKCIMCRKPIDVIYVIEILDDARIKVVEEIKP